MIKVKLWLLWPCCFVTKTPIFPTATWRNTFPPQGIKTRDRVYLSVSMGDFIKDWWNRRLACGWRLADGNTFRRSLKRSAESGALKAPAKTLQSQGEPPLFITCPEEQANSKCIFTSFCKQALLFSRLGLCILVVESSLKLFVFAS